MNGNELKDVLEQFTDESFSDADAASLFNQAKDKIESEREWEMLKVRDTSLAWSVGDTYQTTKTIPVIFNQVISVTPSSYMSAFEPIPFTDLERYRDLSGFYTIDELNRQLRMTGGTSKNETLILFGLRKTDDIVVDPDSPTSPLWPTRFHRIIAIEAAKIFLGGIDADAINFRMTQEQKIELRELRSNMEVWDADLKLRALNGGTARNPDNLSGADRIDRYS